MNPLTIKIYLNNGFIIESDYINDYNSKTLYFKKSDSFGYIFIEKIIAIEIIGKEPEEDADYLEFENYYEAISIAKSFL
jgi:hypothetical protein